MTRRLRDDEAAAALGRARPLLEDRATRVARRTLAGRDPDGGPTTATLTGPALVVFVSTTCDGCRELAGLVRDGVEGLEVLGALRTPPEGLPSGPVSNLVGDRGTWLVGDDAFLAFDVGSTPFFCVLDASGVIVAEGVAFGREQVAALCSRATSSLAQRGAGLRADPR